MAMPQPLLAQHAQEDFTELREDVWQWTLDNAPWLATDLGDPRGDGQLGDPSIEGYDRRVSETRVFLARLEAISGLPYSSPLFTVSDYDSYLSRLEAFPAYIQSFIARNEGGIEPGLTQPCEPMEGYESSISGLITELPEGSVWWQAFETRPVAIAESDWSDLQVRARRAISEGAF